MPRLFSILLMATLSACGSLPSAPTSATSAAQAPTWTLASRDEDLGTRTFLLDWTDEPIAFVDTLAVYLGGFSGMDVMEDGSLILLTDRGPNVDASARAGGPAKLFADPLYTPRLVSLAFQGDDGLTERGSGTLRTPDNRAASGLPPDLNTRVEAEAALGPTFAALPPDPWGIDAEGIAVVGPDMWIADEYRPSLWRVSREDGTVRERFTPTPSDALDRALPSLLGGRTPNRGFEGVAWVGGHIYAALQSPMQTQDGAAATPFVRIVRLDPLSGQADVLTYALDGAAGKIGDLAAGPDGRLLVLEHGPGATPSGEAMTGPNDGWSAHVYAVNVAGAVALAADQTPERFVSERDAERAGVPFLAKTHVLDLEQFGWPNAQRKPEGLAVLRGERLAIVSDNDYGLDAPALDGIAVPTGLSTLLMVFDGVDLRAR